MRAREYPRYRIKDGKLKFLGRYDIAILKDPKDTYFENNDACEEKPLWVGFEIKLNWNEDEDT